MNRIALTVATTAHVRYVGAVLVSFLAIFSGGLLATAEDGASSPPRRVDVWPTSGTINWATASIFWFGKATTNPNYNYVDVRIAYDRLNLYVNATIVDYYLWYDPNGASDPRTYDAFGVYLDTQGDRANSPQTDDYFFVSGYRFWPPGSRPQWQRQGRGTGTGWDETWTPSPAWTDSTGSRFYNSGPNNNSDLDAGWTTTLTIPWATLGLNGPPPAGTAWGLGTMLDDRDDQPPAGAVPNEYWPETLDVGSPLTWGQIVFNPAPYQPPPNVNQQTITIRRGLNATFVQDAYVGGGGTCGGGIHGGGDTPHPGDNLFVQNEADVSDFPCWSKSFLQFDLAAIPPGKVIQSANLTVYEFGGSDPSNAPPSYIQPFAIRESWSETTLSWNDEPLAGENFPGTWVNVVTNFPGWPGVPATWDVTSIVANAYAAGQSANLAIYSADTGYNTGKYFVSSDAGDWDANGRPTLVVTYGNPTLGLNGTVNPPRGGKGSVVTFSLTMIGSGNPLQLVATIPSGLSYVNGSATNGATFDAGNQTVRWSGTPAAGQSDTISYQVTIATATPGLVTTNVSLSDSTGTRTSTTVPLIIGGYSAFLPIVR